MMTGQVNAYREAVVSLVVRGPANVGREIDAVVDTGFNGFLTLPASLIHELGLVWRRRGRAVVITGGSPRGPWTFLPGAPCQAAGTADRGVGPAGTAVGRLTVPSSSWYGSSALRPRGHLTVCRACAMIAAGFGWERMQMTRDDSTQRCRRLRIAQPVRSTAALLLYAPPPPNFHSPEKQLTAPADRAAHAAPACAPGHARAFGITPSTTGPGAPGDTLRLSRGRVHGIEIEKSAQQGGASWYSRNHTRRAA